jgi:hypothetical protein
LSAAPTVRLWQPTAWQMIPANRCTGCIITLPDKPTNTHIHFKQSKYPAAKSVNAFGPNPCYQTRSQRLAGSKPCRQMIPSQVQITHAIQTQHILYTPNNAHSTNERLSNVSQAARCQQADYCGANNFHTRETGRTGSTSSLNNNASDWQSHQHKFRNQRRPTPKATVSITTNNFMHCMGFCTQIVARIAEARQHISHEASKPFNANGIDKRSSNAVFSNKRDGYQIVILVISNSQQKISVRWHTQIKTSNARAQSFPGASRPRRENDYTNLPTVTQQLTF